jgi:hypothetical protein
MLIRIKKIVMIYFKFLFVRVAAYPDPRIALMIISMDKGIISENSKLFFL